MTQLVGIQLPADVQKTYDCLHNQLVTLRRDRDLTMLRGVHTKQAVQNRRKISAQLDDVAAKMRMIRDQYSNCK